MEENNESSEEAESMDPNEIADVLGAIAQEAQQDSQEDQNMDEVQDVPDPVVDSEPIRRSTRMRKPPERLIAEQHMQSDGQFEYDAIEAWVIATIMNQIQERVEVKKEKKGAQFLTTYSLRKGVQKFGDEGKKAAFGEMKQMPGVWFSTCIELSRYCFETFPPGEH